MTRNNKRLHRQLTRNLPDRNLPDLSCGIRRIHVEFLQNDVCRRALNVGAQGADGLIEVLEAEGRIRGKNIIPRIFTSATKSSHVDNIAVP